MLGVATASLLLSVDSNAYARPPSTPLSLFCLASGVAIAILSALATSNSWQGQRLAAAILTTSFAMALMALGQRFGLLGEGSVVNSNGVGSFAGGTIYLAGFLAMAIPLGVWNLGANYSKGKNPTGTVAFAAVVVLIMLTAFFVPEKRGPTLALLSAIFVGLCLTALRTGRFDWLKRGLVAAVAAGATLLSLALLQQHVADLRQIPGIGKLAMIVPLGGHTGDQSRMLIWQKLPEVLTTPLIVPSGEKDPLAAARVWVGYGPDTVESVVPSKVAFMDHSPGTVTHPSTHNYLWDLAVCYGILGCVAYLSFIFCLFRAGLQYLGLSPFSLGAAAAFAAAGTLLGATAASIIYSLGMFAMGAQGGFLAGVLLPVLCVRPRERKEENTFGVGLMIALLAGLTAHLVDMAFIFPVPSTSILFWVVAGMILGPSLRDGLKTRPAEPGGREADPAWPIQAGILVGLTLFAMAFSFIAPQPSGGFWMARLAETIKLIALLFVPVWLVGTKLLCGSKGGSGLRSEHWISLSVAGVLALADWIWLATVDWTEPSDALRFAIIRGAALPVLFLVALAAMTWVGSTRGRDPRNALKTSFISKLFGVALAVIVLGAVWAGPSRYYRSEVAQGLAEKGAGNELAAYALSLRPENWKLRLLLGAGADEEEWTHLLSEGLRISEFNLLNAEAGRRLLIRASAEEDGQISKQLAQRSREHLLRAVRYLHQDEESWVNASIAEEVFCGSHGKARDYLGKANEAVELHYNPQSPPDLHRWGRLYADKAVASAESVLGSYYAKRAISYLDRALADAKDFWSLLARGHAFRILGDRDRAKRDYLEAARIGGSAPPVDATAFVSLMGDAPPTR